MNKLEEGMYVRTKEFGIQKIKWFDNEEPILENGFTALQKAGYKASYDIIDLIEVGDYVNGHKIVDTNSKNGNKVFYFDGEYYSDVLVYFEEKDIKSIVTKEQFESMEYKVCDSNE